MANMVKEPKLNNNVYGPYKVFPTLIIEIGFLI